MRKLAIALVIGALLFVSLPQPAEAGSSTDIALGLASFAVFNQLFGGYVYQPRYHVIRYVYESPQVVYVPRPVYITQSVAAVQAPATPSVIYYPHGRHELRGYEWVWIPNPPTAPTAECRLTGKYVKTPSGFQPECE